MEALQGRDGDKDDNSLLAVANLDLFQTKSQHASSRNDMWVISILGPLPSYSAARCMVFLYVYIWSLGASKATDTTHALRVPMVIKCPFSRKSSSCTSLWAPLLAVCLLAGCRPLIQYAHIIFPRSDSSARGEKRILSVFLALVMCADAGTGTRRSLSVCVFFVYSVENFIPHGQRRTEGGGEHP